MEEFEIIHPSPCLVPYVKHYWFLRTVGGVSGRVRTVPTGHICLVFHRGTRIFSVSEASCQPSAFLSGHERQYLDLSYSGVVDMICVVFRPFGAKAFLHLPLNELNGLKVELGALKDPELAELELIISDVVSGPSGNHVCVAHIEQFLRKRLVRLTDYNRKRMDVALQCIHSGSTDVRELAAQTCLSYKQFNRIFSESAGTNPKEFIRVIRFQRALYLWQCRPEISLVQLAVECGYYDQAHLIKEFKAFSGYTPLEYRSVCLPYSDYFS